MDDVNMPSSFMHDLEELFDERRAFDSRPDVGPVDGLVRRMLRWFQGNPISDISVTSTGTGNVVSLPVESRAMSANLYVSGSNIYYSEAGAVPGVASLKQAQEGSTITIYGHEALTGFQFCSASSTAATLYGTFYT